MTKAIIFDVDGVLLDSFEASLKFFQNLIAHTGHRPPTREEYSQMFHLNMRLVIQKFTGLSTEQELGDVCALRTKGLVPYPVELLAYPEKLEEIIAELSGKYLLGIVTSRLRDSIFEAPRLAALKKYFSAVVAYEDTEKQKPDPAPLLLAAQQLTVKPGEAVYVGDLPSDLQAAHNAGMKALIYSPQALAGADACTSSFDELPALINNL